MKSNFSLYNFYLRILAVVLALSLSSLACSFGQPKAAPTPTPTARAAATKSPTKTLRPTPTNPPAATGELLHLWADAGEATSEYGSTGWTAQQAAGEPDSPTCSDNSLAWASMESDTRESITMFFMDQPLIPTEINIVQSYNPSQVVQVELVDAYSEHADAIIYRGEPHPTAACPYTLSIPVTGIDYLVMGVRITIDQSVLGLGWNEIDAVELVGYAETGSKPQTGADSMAGMPGTWQDPETKDTFVITRQNDQYVVTSVTWKTNNYSIIAQAWQDGSLIWTYIDPSLGQAITYSTTSISGDSLYVDWIYDDGKYGSEVLQRVR